MICLLIINLSINIAIKISIKIMIHNPIPRKTKILCTIGPSVEGVENLVKLINCGMDAARLNFSHGSHEKHLETINQLRLASDITGKAIPILLDLQGPKIRITKMENGGVIIEDGESYIISTEEGKIGNDKICYTNYKPLSREVVVGNTILLDDGYIILKVVKIIANEIHTVIIKGGNLKNNKGIIVPGQLLSAPSLSEKDLEDLKFGLANGVDAVALSFVRSKRDIIELKAAMKIYGREVPIIAKIETTEAYNLIDEIIEESTAIMVARGDLGLEMPAEKVPKIQKEIIARCNEFGKPVITATQMLESMISNPRPTRAEASDVANAVLDGSDCVMLSGETSVGKYPFDSVDYMSKIISNIEEVYPYYNSKFELKSADSERISDSLGKAANVIAEKINAAAIVTLTSSTYTAKNIANYRPQIPIVAMTDDQYIWRRLSFIWGVTPLLVNECHIDGDIFDNHSSLLMKLDFLKHGDKIVFVAGLSENKLNPQNMIKIYEI